MIQLFFVGITGTALAIYPGCCQLLTMSALAIMLACVRVNVLVVFVVVEGISPVCAKYGGPGACQNPTDSSWTCSVLSKLCNIVFIH